MDVSTTLISPELAELLQRSAAQHHKLCPRQVLGVRIGLLAGHLLEIAVPQPHKRLLAIAETDGCFVDGLSSATGCYVGRRTLRVEDYGKTAVTFVDTLTEQALRIAPRSNIRELAWEYAPAARNKWEAQLSGYQYIPDELLLAWQWVQLTVPVKQITGQAGQRVACDVCGEEILNQREIVHETLVLCRPCAGETYFSFVTQP